MSARLSPEVHAALVEEAERRQIALSRLCALVLERHVTGDSLDRLRDDFIEFGDAQRTQTLQLDQLSLGLFEALRTLLLNLTDLQDDDPAMMELRSRVLGS